MDVKFESHADEVLEDVERIIQKSMTEIGLLAERNAKEEINIAVYAQPESKSGYVRTGRLRNSITFATKTDSGKGQEPAKKKDYTPHSTPDLGTVVLGTNVEYAPYVELGTHKMQERPYLRPAIANHMQEYIKVIEDNFNEIE